MVKVKGGAKSRHTSTLMSFNHPMVKVKVAKGMNVYGLYGFNHPMVKVKEGELLMHATYGTVSTTLW